MLGLLLCDTPHPSIVSRFGDYGAMIEHMLKRGNGNKKAHCRAFDVTKQEYPSEAELQSFAGFVISGSRFGVYERGTEKWIVTLEAKLKEFFEKGKRLVGLCFGHQVLATSLGGVVEKNKNGWECAVVGFELGQDARQFFRTDKTVLRLQYVHQDAVVQVPEGAVNLGGTAVSPCEAFVLGGLALGIQGHPEFSPQVVETILDLREGVVEPALLKEARSRLLLEEDSQWLSEFIYSFLTNPVPSPKQS